ncbi:MAG: hypothetical protein A4E42_01283 [Methanoregulaceae archaeon PtaU1.Bin222]|nr:MAG: hypothetical protein A4E42_01283 [Methanoregulaceae archaeon PtaU1.Bin222]
MIMPGVSISPESGNSPASDAVFSEVDLLPFSSWNVRESVRPSTELKAASPEYMMNSSCPHTIQSGASTSEASENRSFLYAISLPSFIRRYDPEL